MVTVAVREGLDMLWTCLSVLDNEKTKNDGSQRQWMAAAVIVTVTVSRRLSTASYPVTTTAH